MTRIDVQATQRLFGVAPHLYGLFFEEINRSGDGGLYAELLRNRSFEDSLLPDRVTLSADGETFSTPEGWVGEFRGGEGKAAWVTDSGRSGLPGWTVEGVATEIDEHRTLNSSRRASLRADFSPGGTLTNDGFRGIAVDAGAEYHVLLFAEIEEEPVTLTLELVGADGSRHAGESVTLAPGGFERHDVTLTSASTDPDARFVIRSDAAASVTFGFASLMPADTHLGHGFRPDLFDMLAGLRPAFLRFPGGCVVEGFTRETATRFTDTIGPVWERPSTWLMWHYRSTNGLGFHEYLQLCEDLGAAAIYVVNCGMTCQTRGCELFHGDDLESFVDEALQAIEYARGDASTPLGARRAEAGHPEPFDLEYIEIGNENFGPEYEKRYALFFDRIRAQYPDIRLISNAHTEQAGLPTEIVGEHFYDSVDYFAERTGHFDSLDRTGPEIFVGEYAVNAGMDAGNLRSALGEVMFLLGVENNQDIVTLTSYAPLLENVDYVAWSPNLIAFDTTRVFGIPAYHALSMLGEHRGEHVVRTEVESGSANREAAGLPGIIARGGGLRFRNATVDGQPVEIAHQLQGLYVEEEGVFTAVEGPDPGIRLPFPGAEHLHRIVGGVFGGDPYQSGTFEIEVQPAPGVPFSLAVWASAQRSGPEGEQRAWTIRTVDVHSWAIGDGASQVTAGRLPPVPLAAEVALELSPDRFHRLRVATRRDGFDCFVDDVCVQRAVMPGYPSAMASATVTDDEVIVKLVNILGEADEVTIELDRDVRSEYTQVQLAGERLDVNSLDRPDAVKPIISRREGASGSFTLSVPAYSFTVLRLAIV